MIGKRFLPKSLFGRVLLILVLPTVLIQLVMAYVFFDRHWDNVTRHMAAALVGDVAFLISQIETASPSSYPQLLADFADTTKIKAFLEPSEAFREGAAADLFPELQDQLHQAIDYPFSLQKFSGGGIVELRVKLENGQVLRLQTSVKRLETKTTLILIYWMLGASALFLLIAGLFMRNQIRPITQLAEVADSFGRGVDLPDFRPRGAAEVRKAARAFMIMRERLKRQLRTRTEMLAGISHDLRTPLTRMKLQLAMMQENGAQQELLDDVQQMEHMIQEYLDFARGEGKEVAVSVNLRELLTDVAQDYRRLSLPVSLMAEEDLRLDLRTSAFRRMLHNIIDNALRYGHKAEIALKSLPHACEITIDDAGAGIPKEKREEVFKPFSRLDPSRNSKTGGVGLGLTIARDIALAHGGSISLETSPAGGLRVVVRLPL